MVEQNAQTAAHDEKTTMSDKKYQTGLILKIVAHELKIM